MPSESNSAEYIYTENIRKSILPLLNEKVNTALEVGCSYGNTLAWIKQEGYCKKAIGIELNEEAAKIAGQRLDEAYCGDLEKMNIPIPPNSINLLLCLDVLEHLNDPWGTLKKLQEQLLAPGGILIASVPNVQHHSIVLPLLFKGEWKYSNSGLLDRTHLRFFTKSSAAQMISNAGFNVESITTESSGNIKQLLSILTFNLFNPLLAFQYLIRAKKL